jgi:hypothetical protein
VLAPKYPICAGGAICDACSQSVAAVNLFASSRHHCLAISTASSVLVLRLRRRLDRTATSTASAAGLLVSDQDDRQAVELSVGRKNHTCPPDVDARVRAQPGRDSLAKRVTVPPLRR